MIVKTWACLNRHCLHTFDSTAGEHPPCLRCGGLHVKWVPRPFGIKSERTRNIDRDVSQLQAVYGDKDYRSPRRHESVAPRVNPVVTPGRTMPFQPVPGWQTEVPINQNGEPLACCAPTGVTARITPAIGSRAPTARIGNRQLGVGGNFEGSWQPPGGIPR